LHIWDFLCTFAPKLAQKDRDRMKQQLIYSVIIYLAAINIVTFFLYGMDKWKARRSKWRVPESTLLWWAAFGGSIGALAGMKTWHHKTQHKKFQYGVPLILIAQIALAGVIVYFMIKRQ